MSIGPCPTGLPRQSVPSTDTTSPPILVRRGRSSDPLRTPPPPTPPPPHAARTGNPATRPPQDSAVQWQDAVSSSTTRNCPAAAAAAPPPDLKEINPAPGPPSLWCPWQWTESGTPGSSHRCRPDGRHSSVSALLAQQSPACRGRVKQTQERGSKQQTRCRRPNCGEVTGRRWRENFSNRSPLARS